MLPLRPAGGDTPATARGRRKHRSLARGSGDRGRPCHPGSRGRHLDGLPHRGADYVTPEERQRFVRQVRNLPGHWISNEGRASCLTHRDRPRDLPLPDHADHRPHHRGSTTAATTQEHHLDHSRQPPRRLAHHHQRTRTRYPTKRRPSPPPTANGSPPLDDQ